MRAVLFCLLLLLSGCAGPFPPDPTESIESDDAYGPPRIVVSTDVAGDAWTFRATINNTTDRSLWLTQRSCDVGAGVALHNATHGQAGSNPPGLACGVGTPRELPVGDEFRFAWRWDGTVLGGNGSVPAPAGVYAATLWTSWSPDITFETVHGQDTHVTAWWPGT